MTEPEEPEVEAVPPSRFERWVLPYVQNSLLRPVLFALLGHVALGIAVLGSLLVRHGNLLALAGIAATLAATAGLVRQELRVSGRPGGFSLAIALTWVGAIVLTWAFVRYDVV